MTRKDVWFLVDKSFMEYVHLELKHLYRKLQDSYKSPPEKALQILRSFVKTHPIGGSTDLFFQKYYRANLISKHKDDPSKVLMFGFLRTLFLGILRGSPRTKVFTKRVQKYKETHRIAISLENFLSLYRRRVGFKKRKLPNTIYQEAGTQSECKDLPEHACNPPKCQYIRTVRKNTPIEYCARHESRRRHHTKTRRRKRKQSPTSS